jgi:hypothetical protein
MTADPLAAWLAPLLDLDAINAEKARAVVEFMDCPPEREAELKAVICRPAQGVLPL